MQQTFEAYAAYVLSQLHNIFAHSNPRPFAGNLEGQEFGADEDAMAGDLLYLNPFYPTINSAQHSYPTPFYPTPYGQYAQSQPYLPPPPGLGFSPNPPYPYPMANAFHPYPPLWSVRPTKFGLCAPPFLRATDRKAKRKANKAIRPRRKRRQAPLTPPCHALLSCALPDCTFIATTMAG